MTRWTAQDITDQTGRCFVVTGANSGLGLETTMALVARGAHVVMACRNPERAAAAAQRVHDAGLPGSTEVVELDLGDLDSVRALGERMADWRIETLVNNAGVMAVPEGRTAQGHELQFGTNVLGHFLLTALLAPRLTDRVVWLSSLMHKLGRIDLDDLDWRERPYSKWGAYCQSKLADLVLAYEMQRRLTGAGSLIRSVAAHPGYAATNLQGRSGDWTDPIAKAANRIPFLAQPAGMGALPSLYAATVPDLPGGAFIGPDGPGESRGWPVPVGSTRASHDRDVARRLWHACEELTDQRFEI